MNAMPEKNENNAVEFNPPKDDVASKSPKLKYNQTKNYNIKRKEACNGTVQPIKDVEDIKRISEYFWNRGQYRDWCLFNVGVCTGFRASDLLRFKVSDVTTQKMNRKLQVNSNAKIRMKEKKTGKYRIVLVPESALKVIATYIDKVGLQYNDWLFPSYKSSSPNSLRSTGGTSISQKTGIMYAHKANPKVAGDPLDVDSFGRIMRKVQKDMNLPYNLGTHSCRKTFGYQFMVQHRDDVMALAWLQHSYNHSSQAITLHYIGLDSEVDELYYSGINYGVNTHSENS